MKISRIFKRDISIGNVYLPILFLSVVNLLAQVLSNYLLGHFMQPEGYGAWRKLLLYSSFSGVIHLGYLDGQYLNWLKKGKELFSFSNFTYCAGFLFLTHFLAFWVLILLIKSNSVTTLIIVQCYLNSIIFYFQIYFLKEQRFVFSSLLLVLIQVVFVLLIFILKDFISSFQIVAYINFSVYILAILMIFLVLLSNKTIIVNNISLASFKSSIKGNISYGFFVLLSGLILLLFQNADKIIVSNFYSLHTFGYYSYASVFINIFIGLATSMTNILLSKIFLSSSYENNKLLEKSYKLIIGLCFVFPIVIPFLEKPITLLMPGYARSYQFIYPLLVGLAPTLLINLILFNLYKKYTFQKSYFIISAVLVLLQFLILYLSILNHLNLKFFAFIPGIFYFILLMCLDIFLSNKFNHYLKGLPGRLILSGSLLAFNFAFYFFIYAK